MNCMTADQQEDESSGRHCCLRTLLGSSMGNGSGRHFMYTSAIELRGRVVNDSSSKLDDITMIHLSRRRYPRSLLLHSHDDITRTSRYEYLHAGNTRISAFLVDDNVKNQ